jgi:hypothetical protein
VLPRGSDNRPDAETVLIVIEFAGNYILSRLSAPSLAAAGRGPQEMFHVLRPGGHLFIADFGPRQSPSIFRSPRVVAKL